MIGCHHVPTGGSSAGGCWWRGGGRLCQRLSGVGSPWVEKISFKLQRLFYHQLFADISLININLKPDLTQWHSSNEKFFAKCRKSMKLYCIEVTPGRCLNKAGCGLPDHEPDGKRASSCRLLIAALLGLQLLCACAQPVPVHSGTSGPVITQETTVQSTIDKPARVIVRFRRAVPYSDATFLQDITLQIQARITYVASVSGDTHVYLLEPLPGSKHADALRRLANLSIVSSVELDQLATHF